MAKLKKEIKFILLLSLVFFLFLYGCKGSQQNSSGPRPVKKLKIAVIPKAMSTEFWKTVQAGTIKASREFGVEVFWKGPQREDDRAQQITVVEDFISRGVDGIVLAPLDDRALMRPVNDAARENIPVVIFDSSLQGHDYVSYVATDNYKGGVLAAKKMGQLLKGKGKLLFIRYQEGHASTTERENGFLDTLKKEFPGISLLIQDQYAGTTTETAYQLTENLISRFPEFDGVFCPNESSTFGALRALQEAGLAGKVYFVGFDSNAKMVQALRDGHIHALVLQNPLKMGYLGVRQMVLYLQGRKIDGKIDTGVCLATKENMDAPEIRFLLQPDLSEYFK